MSRIFISYKRVDKDKVFKIKDWIESALGEKCWIDVDGIESDALFTSVIIDAIDKAEIVLFMYSKAHTLITDFENDWTIRELNYANDESKRIVFVNIDRTPLTKWFKFMYYQKQQVDGTSNDSIHKLLTDLTHWLKADDGEELIEQGLVPVKNENGKFVFIGTIDGKEHIPFKYDYASRFKEGLALVVDGGKRGFIDVNGNVAVPLEYEWAEDFSGGIAKVKQNGKYGFIDKHGDIVIPLIYDKIGDLHEGCIKARLHNKWGYLDMQGIVVVPFCYEAATDFHMGKASIRSNQEWHTIDKNDNVLWNIDKQ